MKIDKHLKDLSRRLDTFSGNYDSDEDNDNYGLYEHDDDYYLDIGSQPPRFAYYRHIRAEKWKALGPHEPSDYYNTTTQDELDYGLKRKLRMTPEERYRREKQHWYWHESSWYWRRANGYDGYGCNDGECVTQCRFYPEYGRIEDEEVLEDHNKLVESYLQRNAIVEPPSENELLNLAKIHRFT